MTKTLQDISKGARRQILGQVMNLNCFAWIFYLTLVKQRCFDQSHPPAPLAFSHVAPLIGLVMFVQGEG
jgi:hypothetical protein